jgi:pilus assembly protein CpaB
MKRNITLYVIMLFAFCLGAIVISKIVATPKSEATVLANQECLVASGSLGPGNFLEARDIQWKPCPSRSENSQVSATDYIQKGSDGLTNYLGSILRVPVGKDDFITLNVLIKPADNEFLSAVLRPGSRAVAIRVDDVTGGAGLIRPGNLVDVIVSGDFGRDSTGAAGLATAKTLLTAIRVIAVNRDIGLGESKKEEGRNLRENAKGTVTLEVSPKEVELLTVGRSMGTLSLSLCSLSAEASLDTQPASGETKASEIAQTATNTDSREKRVVVTMFGTEQSQHISR